MRALEDDPPGASRTGKEELREEIARQLDAWQSRYGPIRLQLAWDVLETLWQHVEKRHGIIALCEFYEGSLAITDEQVRLIGKTLEDDKRDRVVH